MSMKTELVVLSKIKPNKANPRVIKDSKFHKLVNSILVFPKMMEARPIVVNGEMVVLGGNMRLKALETIKTMDEPELRRRLGNCTDFTLKPEAERKALVAWWIAWQDKPQTFVVNAKEFSDAEQKQFIVKDNASFGEWDFDALTTEFDVESLGDWGVDITAPFKSEDFNDMKPSYSYQSIGQSSTQGDTETTLSAELDLPECPPELDGVDVSPTPLPKLEGDDETVKGRVIIVFDKDDASKVAELLGLDELTQVLYRYSQLPCAK